MSGPNTEILQFDWFVSGRNFLYCSFSGVFKKALVMSNKNKNSWQNTKWKWITNYVLWIVRNFIWGDDRTACAYSLTISTLALVSYISVKRYNKLSIDLACSAVFGSILSDLYFCTGLNSLRLSRSVLKTSVQYFTSNSEVVVSLLILQLHWLLPLNLKTMILFIIN